MQSVRAFLTAVRASGRISARQWAAALALSALLGAVMGLAAKMTDSVSVVGAIGTRLSVWVLAAALLAAFARSPGEAAARVFLFFAAMLAAYYLYTAWVLHFTSRSAMLFWGALAAASPLCAVIAWYGRGRGWWAALCAALPAALAIREGYPFLYTRDLTSGFALLAAAALLALLPKGWRQVGRTLAACAIASVLLIGVL